jgi:hypothetical protein
VEIIQIKILITTNGGNGDNSMVANIKTEMIKGNCLAGLIIVPPP